MRKPIKPSKPIPPKKQVEDFLSCEIEEFDSLSSFVSFFDGYDLNEVKCKQVGGPWDTDSTLVFSISFKKENTAYEKELSQYVIKLSTYDNKMLKYEKDLATYQKRFNERETLKEKKELERLTKKYKK